MMMEKALRIFQRYAKAWGFTEKIVGDYGYRRPWKKTEIIRFLSAKNGKIMVAETGKGTHCIYG